MQWLKLLVTVAAVSAAAAVHVCASVADGKANLVLGQTVFSDSAVNIAGRDGLYAPSSTAYDASSGRLYVVDSLNNRVLWWNNAAALSSGQYPDGVIGQADFESSESATTRSGLYSPSSVAVDASGNVWVSDFNNNRVLKFAKPVSNGEQAALVLGQADFTSKTAALTQTGLWGPGALLADPSGNIWVAVTNQRRVLRYASPSTNGQAADLVLGQADFTSNYVECVSTSMLAPSGITMDLSGNIWICDALYNRVLKYNAPFSNGEQASLVLGQPDFTSSASATTQSALNSPRGVSVDRVGVLWVCDYFNKRIVRFANPTSNGQAADLVIGQADFTSKTAAATQTGLDSPRGISLDASGNIFVCDYNNNRVLRYASPFSNAQAANLVLGQADYTGSVANLGHSNGFNCPGKAAVDEISGRLYLADSSNNRVVWWNSVESLENGKVPDGVLGQSSLDGHSASLSGSGMSDPRAVFVDGNGALWVADSGNNRVLKFTSPSASGQAAALVLGQTVFTSSASALTQSGMNYPSCITADQSGNIWVSDANNYRILKYNAPSSNGQAASLVLGQSDFTTTAGGAVSQSNLGSTYGIAMDASNNLWVADPARHRVLKFVNPSSNNQNASIVLGQTDFTSYASATTKYGLSSPNDVGVSADGAIVWVADSGNKRVMQFISPLANGCSASLVLGQADFVSNTAVVSQDGFKYPYYASLDRSGNVWVADVEANRVLKFAGMNRHKLASVSPASDMNTDTALAMTLTGQFDYGTTPAVRLSMNGQAPIAASSTRFISTTKITCSFNLMAAATGYWDIVVSTGPSSAITTTISAGFLVSPMAVASITPSSAGNAGPVEITNLAGQGFMSGSVVKLSKSGQADIPAYGVNVSSQGRITCFLDLSGAATGCWDVVVSTGPSSLLSATFSAGFLVSPMTVAFMSPNTAGNGGVAEITNLAGQGFLPGSTVKLSKSGQADIQSSSVTVVSQGKITCLLDLTGAATGYWDVTVSSGGASASLAQALNVIYQPVALLDDTADSTVKMDLSGREVELFIPEGTFGMNVSLTVLPASVPASTDPLIRPSLAGIEIKNDRGLQPAKPITLTVSYTHAEIAGLDESKLILARYDTASARWVAIQSTVNTVTNHISGTLRHLSQFAIVQLAAADDLSRVKAYPNPFSPLRDPQGLTIANLTAEARVKIFSVSGELVAEPEYSDQSGMARWDGKNPQGSVVASGIYVMLIKSPAGSKKLKIAVEK